MRYSMIMRGLLAASALSFVAAVRAEGPAVSKGTVTNIQSSSVQSIRLDDEDHYVQQLREFRRQLNGIHDQLDKEHPDRGGHRHEAIEAIDHAVKAIDDEIVEYKNHH